MNKFKRIVFWAALLTIALWLIISLLLWVFDLDFAKSSYRNIYQQFWFFAIPAVILLTLFRTISSEDSALEIVAKAIGTLLVAFIAIFFMTVSAFAGYFDMCAWTDVKQLYEKKDDSNVQIIVREYGCGATDGGSPVVSVFQVQSFTPFFIRTTKIDTTLIDKSEWVKSR